MTDQPPELQPTPPPPPNQLPSPNLPPPPAYYPQAGVSGQPPPPPAYMPVGAVGGGLTLMQQFSGSAAWSVGLGLVSIIVPFLLSRVLFFLPLIGIYYGIRAIRRGQMIGGVVGLVLNVIGGLITVIALFVR